jgi:hypothetical protein
VLLAIALALFAPAEASTLAVAVTPRPSTIAVVAAEAVARLVVLPVETRP